MSPDNDQDQYRIPQGSLFIELMNLRATGNLTDSSLPGVSTSLYENVGGQTMLNLSKMAPAGLGPYGSQPVWRIGISNIQPATGSSPNFFLRQTATNSTGPQSSFRTNQFSLENGLPPYVGAATLNNGLVENPLNLNSMPGNAMQRGFDRLVYFTNINSVSPPSYPMFRGRFPKENVASSTRRLIKAQPEYRVADM